MRDSDRGLERGSFVGPVVSIWIILVDAREKVFEGESHPSCQGVPFAQFSSPLHLTLQNKVLPLILTEYAA